MMARTRKTAMRMRLGPSPNDMKANLSEVIESRMALNGAESRLSSSGISSVTAIGAVVVVTMYLDGCNHRERFRNGLGPHMMRG